MRRAGAFAVALALAACASPPPPLPAAPMPAGPGITIQATPVAERPPDSTEVTVCPQPPCGEWTWAGGLHLTSADTARLHGLSDLDMSESGRLTAVSDAGDLLEGRLVFGADGWIAGIVDARLEPLTDPEGRPIAGKAEADAEGVATLASGDRLVSFEHDPRIWLYPAAGGPPRPVPAPPAAFPANAGMEALAADRPRGPDAYIVGAEETGETWLCRVSTTCQKGPTVALPPGYGLVAATRLPRGRMAWLLRAWDPARGNRIELRVTDDTLRVVDALRIARPATVDNFEGLAAVGLAEGVIRFYLISDDNFAASQRTLLVAFDWRPAAQ